MIQNEEIGICCFCGEGCNPSSQSCGRCARTLTGFSLGWNVLPSYLQNLYPDAIKPDEKKSSPENKDEPKPLRRSKRHRKNDK